VSLREKSGYNWAMISAVLDRAGSTCRYRYLKLKKDEEREIAKFVEKKERQRREKLRKAEEAQRTDERRLAAAAELKARGGAATPATNTAEAKPAPPRVVLGCETSREALRRRMTSEYFLVR
jgi:hypothetical protein